MPHQEPQLSRVSPHRPGRTRACYSRDGQYVFTTGSDRVVRRFHLASTDEPLAIDPLHDDAVSSIACTNDRLATCSEDGSVSLFDEVLGQESSKLCRTTLPMRHIAFSPDGSLLAIASDETRVKVVQVDDMMNVMLVSADRSVRHVSFHPSGNLLALTDAAGNVKIYSLSTQEPTLLESLQSLTRPSADLESDIASKCVWHPDGQSFGVSTIENEVAVYDRSEWRRQLVFKSAGDGHTKPITDFAWSPNGAYLATAGQDDAVVIWHASTRAVIHRIKTQHTPQQLLWHPTRNVLSWTTAAGELVTAEEVIPQDLPSPATRPIRGLLADATPVAATSGAGTAAKDSRSRARESLLEDLEDAGADWIEDDDGAGYVPNFGERDAVEDAPPSKRRRVENPAFTSIVHPPVAPGSTPWRQNRRYLTLNSVGWIWSVDQDSHYVVTVEFHDRDRHRQYHFTDASKFEFAALDDEGALFASPVRTREGIKQPVQLHYRPHNAWTANATWSITLPVVEEVAAIALTRTAAIVASTNGYIRGFDRAGGVAKSMVHARSLDVVCLIGRDECVMSIGNCGVSSDGVPVLSYVVYKVRDGTPSVPVPVCEGVLPGCLGALRSCFFGDDGQAYVYSDAGLLSVLSGLQASGLPQWVPVLDTTTLTRRTGRDESYWPVGVTDESRFVCVILKGAERHPSFPRPITSDFDLHIPILPLTSPDDKPFEHGTGKPVEVPNTEPALSVALVTSEMYGSLLSAEEDDVVEDRVSELRVAADTLLLKLLNMACRKADDARALALATALANAHANDLSPSTILDAALKVAAHHNRVHLAERIGRL
ncbi:DNA polymerase alpha accessory factor Mcl1 [Savitreella phatthalungensis]